MNFELVGTGHSFKGAMAYYLHDKRQEQDGPHPETSDRVAWTEFRNLAVLTPETATRVMIATASQADQLKAAAGIKNTGRKATGGPVYAFSMNWQPGELPDRDPAEMRAVADRALKILGLDHLQSVMVAHSDTAHPHVHVIVNRVDPTTGKTATIAAPRVQTLNRYAYEYERDRGKIVSPNRAEAQQEIDRKREQHPDPDKRRAYIEDKKRAAAEAKRTKAEFQRAAEAKPAPDRAKPDPAQQIRVDRASADPQRKPRQSEGAMLKELHDAQKARHKDEWRKLAAADKARRSAIYDKTRQHIARAVAEAKEQHRPLWGDLFKQQRDEKRRFDEREKRLGGIVRNCIDAVRNQKFRGDGSDRGFLTMAFSYLASRDARQSAFSQSQTEARERMATELRQRTDARVQQMKDVRAQTLAKTRDQYADTRAALMTRQNAEQAKMREAWRQLYQRRGRNPEYPSRQKAAVQQEQKPMQKEFDKARQQLPIANQPMKEQRLSTPAPAPSPAGAGPAPKAPHVVPQVNRAAEWAKTAQGRETLAKDAPAPAARQQFDRTADPKPEPATPEPQKQQTRAEYWNERAKQAAADRGPEVTRDRSKDRDFERDR